MSEPVKRYEASELYDKQTAELIGECVEVYLAADYEQVLAEKEAESAGWKSIAEQWASDAESARQPGKFYEGYNEGVMNAMQALLARSETSLASLKARCEGMRAVIETVADYSQMGRAYYTLPENIIDDIRAVLSSLPVEGFVERAAK